MKKSKKLTAILLSGVMAFGVVSVGAMGASAADGSVNITVSASDISASGAKGAIQSALNEARYNAAADNPYTVTVEAGSYSLSACLYIYGNTTLKLNGVTLTRTGDGNMLKVGDNDSNSSSDGVTGYYYKNIAVEGGMLDGNSAQGCTGTMVKVGHTEGFTMTGVTLQNCLNSHIMETGGVKGLTVSDCTFKNQITDESGKSSVCYEALQLDILYSTNLIGYRSEDLPTEDVTVSGCTFTNVPRGVGSHTAILNKPMDNISVTDCTFTQTASSALQFLYTKNLTLSGNTISGASRSIVVTMASTGLYRPSTVAGEGGLTTTASDSFEELGDQNITISDNKITMTTDSNPYDEEDRIGIYASGTVRENSQTDAPDGTYYINGVSITGNTVTNATGSGIRLLYAENSSVTSNAVAFMSGFSDGNDYYGVSLRESPENGVIGGNTVTGATTNGIYVYINSSVTDISGNTVSKCGNNGIYVGENSSANSIINNAIENAAGFGIAAGSGSTVATISGNTVRSSGERGVAVFGDSNVDRVTGNIISYSGEDGILFSSGSTGKLIENNVVYGSGEDDIHVSSDSSVTTIGENSFEAVPGSCSIGDVNGDGTVDISDATMIQKYVAQIIALADVQKAAADVNGDGTVDISDATMVQKYVAQIIGEFA